MLGAIIGGAISEVAPRAGAWIEMVMIPPLYTGRGQSHPVRVRGLKYHADAGNNRINNVAPRAGAWIEITGN